MTSAGGMGVGKYVHVFALEFGIEFYSCGDDMFAVMHQHVAYMCGVRHAMCISRHGRK